MALITIVLEDTPTGGVSLHTNFKPAIGAPCTNAQSAALDIIRRTTRDWGVKTPAGEVEGITCSADARQ